MDRSAQEQWVQLKILKRFDVLVDCSDLSETVLGKLLKRLPLPIGDNLTFASWCDQVFGSGVRPLIVYQHDEVSGQTRMTTLTLGLADQLRRQDRSLKALQKKLDQTLPAQQEPVITGLPASAPDVETEESWRWRSFYSSGRDGLHRLIGTVEGIERVHIFDYQGATNRTYRIELLKLVKNTLTQLKQMGIGVTATFPPLQFGAFAVDTKVFYGNPAEARDHLIRSFSVDEMPTDILYLPEDGCQGASAEETPKNASFMVELHILDNAKFSDDAAMQHLSFYLQKIFQALAKSADHVPRGVLREMLLLGVMLSMTAPNVPIERTLSDLPFATFLSTFDDSWRPREERKTELDPGQILSLLMAVLGSNLHRR